MKSTEGDVKLYQRTIAQIILTYILTFGIAAGMAMIIWWYFGQIDAPKAKTILLTQSALIAVPGTYPLYLALWKI